MPSAYNPFLDPDLEPLPSFPSNNLPRMSSTNARDLKTKKSWKFTKYNSFKNPNSKHHNPNPIIPMLTWADYGFPDNSDAVKNSKRYDYQGINWRGIVTLTGLLWLIMAILTLFVFYPIFVAFKDEALRMMVVGDVRVNGTGQVPDL
jgi:hypothetical protein